MYREDFLERLKRYEEDWRERNREEIEEAEAKETSCEDGIPLNLLYTPSGNHIDFFKDIGFPGEFPYTRGIDASGYRKGLWTPSQYAGFGNQKETNQLFKKMIEHGNVPYLALDLPTQNGYDPDHPMAMGEVARAGTPVNSLRDWEIIFDGINVGDIYIGTVANAQAAVILAMHGFG
jgi:methylmalonyl-CoA mutase N-terminal domain/subunit